MSETGGAGANQALWDQLLSGAKDVSKSPPNLTTYNGTGDNVGAYFTHPALGDYYLLTTYHLFTFVPMWMTGIYLASTAPGKRRAYYFYHKIPPENVDAVFGAGTVRTLKDESLALFYKGCVVMLAVIMGFMLIASLIIGFLIDSSP